MSEAKKPPRKRLKERIEELDQPWHDEEAMNIALEELNLPQKKVAEKMGCSAPSISNWKDKLNIGVERVREKQGGGETCVRCKEHETPRGSSNEMCDHCLTFVRLEDSNFDRDIDFPDAVKEAKGWTA